LPALAPHRSAPPREGTVKKALVGLLLTMAVLATASGSGRAQGSGYPIHPVRIIVAFPAGGLLDTVSRIVGDKLSQVLGQQFIIESRPAPAERWRQPQSRAPNPMATH
jgi:hypothetical protein